MCVCVCVANAVSLPGHINIDWFLASPQRLRLFTADQLKTPEGGLFIRGFNVFQKVSCLMKAAFSPGVTVCLRKCFLSHESGFSSGFQCV